MNPTSHYEPEIDLVALAHYIRKYTFLILIASLLTGIIFFIYRYTKISANLEMFSSQYAAYESAYANYQEKWISYQDQLEKYESAKAELSAMIVSLPDNNDEVYLKKIQAITNYITYGNPVAPVEPTKVKIIGKKTEFIQCIKFFVIGAITCGFFIFFLLSCLFVFSDILKDESDLQRISGSYVVGSISEELTVQKLTQIIEPGLHYQLISSLGKDICSHCAELLPEKTVSIGNPETDIEAVKSFDSSLPIILVEQVGKSKNKQISQLIRFLNSAHCKVLGCITVAQR